MIRRLGSPPPPRRRRRSHLFRPLHLLLAATISAALLLLLHYPSAVDSPPDPALELSVLHAGNDLSDADVETPVGPAVTEDGAGDDPTEADVEIRKDHVDSLQADMAAKLGDVDTLEDDMATEMGDMSSSQTDVATKLGHVDVLEADVAAAEGSNRGRCATVEEMGGAFRNNNNSSHKWEKESLRVRELIRRHFEIHGMFTALVFIRILLLEVPEKVELGV